MSDESSPEAPVRFPTARSAPRLEAAGWLGLAGLGGLVVGFWFLDLGELAAGRGFSGSSALLTVILALILGLPALGACAVGRRLRRERSQEPALSVRQRGIWMALFAVGGFLLVLWKGLPGVP